MADVLNLGVSAAGLGLREDVISVCSADGEVGDWLLAGGFTSGRVAVGLLAL